MPVFLLLLSGIWGAALMRIEQLKIKSCLSKKKKSLWSHISSKDHVAHYHFSFWLGLTFASLVHWMNAEPRDPASGRLARPLRSHEGGGHMGSSTSVAFHPSSPFPRGECCCWPENMQAPLGRLVVLRPAVMGSGGSWGLPHTPG